MRTLEELRTALPDAAKDIRLNLQSVLAQGSLNDAQKWGVAVASAAASRNQELASAMINEARSHVAENVVQDALSAAALMAMNNVFYRFRHLVGKEVYATKPARLRMNKL